MKERFTENARMAINLAAEAAKQLAHGYIGTLFYLGYFIQMEQQQVF